MKKLLALPLASVLLLAGCASDDAESLVKQTIAAMDETGQVMATVKDEPSAQAAVPRLKALAERRKKIEEKMAAVKTPPAAEQAELQKKYAARLTEVTTQLMQQAMRVSTVPGGKVALEAMDGK
jgi:uncharacterized lipoprotein YajG